MVIPGTTLVTIPVPSFPQNRRRMRRGARKRHALSRKVDPRDEYREGAFLAHDTAFLPLSPPFPRGGAQPQSLDRSWLAWMAHEVRREEEDEQCRLFGGDADDDALRALGILYDSIRDDGEKKSEAPPPASGVSTAGINNENNDKDEGNDKDEDEDKDINFPPLPYGLHNVLSKPAKLTKTMRRHNSRRTPLTIPTPPLLSSYLLDDSEILRLTAMQSPSPAEQPNQHQSLPTHASFPTQFPVPLHTPGATTDRTDKPTATIITTTKLADPSWTLIPQDPDWVLLDDDS